MSYLDKLKYLIKENKNRHLIGAESVNTDKYDVVDEITEKIIEDQNNKIEISGCKIVNTNTINGIRFSLSNGSWGLVRASSNKPSLVIVIESLVSKEEVKDIFAYINNLLNEIGKIGEYDQKL